MGSFVAGLDATVVNVALPGDPGRPRRRARRAAVGRERLPADARLADPHRRLARRHLRRAAGLLARASRASASRRSLCALAPTIEVLVARRALQGIFGALLTPSALAVIVATFPPAERGAAIGSWTAWSGIAMVVGPFVGGWLVDSASWRWIFLDQRPVRARDARARARRGARPGARATAARRSVDWLGAALCAVGLAGPVYALIRQPDVGWGSPQVLVPLVGGVDGVRRCSSCARRGPRSRCCRSACSGGATSPPATSRRSRCTAASASCSSCSSSTSSRWRGTTRCRPGLATLPSTVVMFAPVPALRRASPIATGRASSWASGRSSPRAAWRGWRACRPMSPTSSTCFPALVVFSLGLAATVAPLTAAVLADADEENAGIASGVNNAIARVASLMAIAAVGAVVASAFTSSIDASLAGVPLTPEAQSAVARAQAQTFSQADTAGLPPREAAVVARAVQDASVHAFDVGMWISAVLVGARRPARPGLHRQSRPRRARRGLLRRSDRGRPGGPGAGAAHGGAGPGLSLPRLSGHMTDAADARHTRTASYLAEPGEVNKVLLLYSGGLDTSVMLKWIQDEYDAEVVALTINLGQPGEDYDVVKGKALRPRRRRRRGHRRARGVRPRLHRPRDQGERRLRPRLPALHRPRPPADRQARGRLRAQARLRHRRPRLHRQGQRPGPHRGDGRDAGAGAEGHRARPRVADGPRGGDRLRARARDPDQGRRRDDAVFDRRQPLGPLLGGQVDRGPRARARGRRLPARHAPGAGARTRRRS